MTFQVHSLGNALLLLLRQGRKERCISYVTRFHFVLTPPSERSPLYQTMKSCQIQLPRESVENILYLRIFAIDFLISSFPAVSICKPVITVIRRLLCARMPCPAPSKKRCRNLTELAEKPAAS